MSNLVRIRTGTYYFRYIIPKNERHLFPNHKLEYRKSLKTNSKREALERAHFLYVELRHKIDPLLQPNATNVNNHQFLPPSSSSLLDICPDECFIPKKDDYLLSDLLDRYINQKSLSIDNSKTLDSYRNTITLMIRIMGITCASELDAQCVRSYKETLPKIPKNLNSKPNLKNKPFAEIITLSDGEKISQRTVMNILTNTRAFLTFLYTDQYIDNNYSDILKRVFRSKELASSARAVFTTCNLNKIFMMPEYSDPEFIRPDRFWVPIIALFSGLRLNEISQLTVSDISSVDDILVFDVNNMNGKKVKNCSSIRLVPIHKTILQLGFRKYLDEQNKRKEVRLFRLLRPDKYGHCGRKISRWFNEVFIQQCGITKDTNNGTLVFHSFRHTFINQAKQQQLDINILKELVGHSATDITLNHYGKSYSIKVKKKEIDKLNFNIQLPIKWLTKFQ